MALPVRVETLATQLAMLEGNDRTTVSQAQADLRRLAAMVMVEISVAITSLRSGRLRIDESRALILEDSAQGVSVFADTAPADYAAVIAANLPRLYAALELELERQINAFGTRSVSPSPAGAGR